MIDDEFLEDHITVFCTKSVFKSWKNKELLYDSISKSFIPVGSIDKGSIFNPRDYTNNYNDDLEEENILRDNYRQSHPFYSYSDFFDYGTDDDYTTFWKESTVDGVEVVAFGEWL